jgi:hypothetical protein
MKVTMTQKKKRKLSTGSRSLHRGYSGPGWELSVTGEPAWVKRMVKKWVPEIQQIARLSNVGSVPPTNYE